MTDPTPLTSLERRAPSAALAAHLITSDHLVPDPATGEVVPLADASPALLAGMVDALDDLHGQVRDARSTLRDELGRRLGTEKGMSAGAHRVERTTRNEWDADATWQALSGLVEDGLVGPQEAAEAMPEEVIRKPDGRKLNALLTRLVGEDPEAAAPLARARTTRRGVRVARVAHDGTAEEVAP